MSVAHLSRSSSGLSGDDPRHFRTRSRTRSRESDRSIPFTTLYDTGTQVESRYMRQSRDTSGMSYRSRRHYGSQELAYDPTLSTRSSARPLTSKSLAQAPQRNKFDELIGMLRMTSLKQQHHTDSDERLRYWHREKSSHSRTSYQSRDRSNSGDRQMGFPRLGTHRLGALSSSHRELRPALARSTDIKALEDTETGKGPYEFWNSNRTSLWTRGAQSMLDICREVEAEEPEEPYLPSAPSLPVLPKLPPPAIRVMDADAPRPLRKRERSVTFVNSEMSLPTLSERPRSSHKVQPLYALERQTSYYQNAPREERSHNPVRKKKRRQKR